jgi:flavin reductase (DIM6/NTAB) family NADH-FMN oxidoreductase RutF
VAATILVRQCFKSNKIQNCMHHYSLQEIKSWDRFYRANFINSLSGFKSATLIGTCSTAGSPNVAIFSNIVHIGADPAMVGFINRPKEAAPHTIANIEATGEYTMNHVQATFIEQAHQTSARYAAGESEFEKAGLGIEWKENSKAPFVAESAIKYSMELVEIIPIKYNGSFFVIGKIKDVFADGALVGEDGFLYIEKAGSITTLGIDGYYETNLLTRFSYAKPGIPTKKIK